MHVSLMLVEVKPFESCHGGRSENTLLQAFNGGEEIETALLSWCLKSATA